MKDFKCMLGAACGDIAGSVYEHHNIKYEISEEKLITEICRFTDDTVMTCAVAEGICNALSMLSKDWMSDSNSEEILSGQIRESMQKFGRKYPRAGYGGRFRRWIWEKNPKPYYSWGNGSAMRASYAGWVAGTIEEAEKLARISASVTHDHPDGINGAKVVAGSIFLLRNGATKEQVKEYVENMYPLDFTLDEIRENYNFDVSCHGSVPQAVEAFLEGDNFGNVISKAISIGGDSDTIAAIAGSIAEVIYPIPDELKERTIKKLDKTIEETLKRASVFCQ
ncbi:MAG: ADP-ribosylglycohydrolase family protein [Candidatus Fimousia sp.]